MPKFNFTRVSLAIAASLYMSQAYSSIVNENIDYQIFRDFAENKGVFTPNATNLTIKDKTGKVVYTFIKPMVDFSASDSAGVSTLIEPQYTHGVKHNNYSNLSYGGFGRNPDYKRAVYHIVDLNNHNNTKFTNPDNVYNKDLHAPRLHKLVTETAPTEYIKDAFTGNQTYIFSYLNKKRFPVFFRMGSGTQYTHNPETKEQKFKAYAYDYVIGGMTPLPDYAMDYKVQFTTNWEKYPFSSVIQSGDSGSGMYVFDTKVNRWVLYSFAQSGNAALNRYIIVDNRFLTKSFNDDLIAPFSTSSENLSLVRKGESAIYSLVDGETSYDFSGYDKSKSINDDKINYREDNDARSNAGKNITLTNSSNATIDLANNLNQGAGSITFNGNYTLKSDNNSTYTGAGIIINPNKKVVWQINGIENDNLHRLGAGTLEIAAKGVNPAGLRVGDGVTFLNQKPDENGNVQAASLLHIASGRPTVILGDSNQVEGSNIYFGFRGGRLDLNGNTLSLDRIRSVDNGARIVNNSSDKAANLTINGSNDNSVEISTWKWNTFFLKNTLFYYKGGYFRFKRSEYLASYIPNPGDDGNQYKYVGNSLDALKQEKLIERNQTLFSGNLGETDKSKLNGTLNVTFRPQVKEAVFAIAGDNNINGDLNLEAGTTVLQGRATEHAFDVLKGDDVTFDDDWINTKSSITNINVASDAVLELSRNTDLTANVNLDQGATFVLGYGKDSHHCFRSDYTGVVTCSTDPISAKALESLEFSKFSGTINSINSQAMARSSSDQSQNAAKLIINQLYEGTINGLAADVVVNPTAIWTLDKSTSVNKLTQNSGIINLAKSHGNYHTLTINSGLSGEGTINFKTNISENIGDKLVIKDGALSSGNFNFIVDNTGSNTTNTAKLYLVEGSNLNITPTLINKDGGTNYVDLGAYRYKLNKDEQGFNLFNKLIFAEQEKARIEAEKAKAEKEKAEKEKAKAKAEAERIAAEKAKQKEWISSSANRGVIQLVARFEQLRLAADHSAQNLMYKNHTNTGLYLNGLVDNTKFKSDHYRNFKAKQQGSLLGYDLAVNNKLIIGADFTALQSNIDLDDGSLNKIKTLVLGFYAKYNLNKNFYVGANIGGGNQYSEMKKGGTRVKVRQRSLYQNIFLGSKLNIAKTWTIQAQIGATNYWLDGRNYDFKQHSFSYKTHNVQQYSLDLSLNKNITLGIGSLDIYTTIGLAKYTNHNVIIETDRANLTAYYPDHALKGKFGINYNITPQWQVLTSIEKEKTDNTNNTKGVIGLNYHF